MKGFITVATGNDQYYNMAYNLLRSYRFHSGDKTPFAIICDQRNEWTEDFDDVIILDNPAHSYVDKLRILDMSPYDETIFIDADSLVYKDINELWRLFENGPDIGLLGSTCPIDSEKGLWKTENLGALKDKVSFKVMCQGGLYYVRNKGENLPAIKETCKYIAAHYLDYHFNIFEKILEDETILCLTAAVHHIRPVAQWSTIYAYYPEVRCVSANIRKGRLRFICENGSGKPNRKGYFLHFGALNTLGPQSDGLYYREVSRLKYRSSWRQDFKDTMILFGRRVVNHSRFFHAIANLFPKGLRSRFNKVDSRGREHVCWGDPDSYK